MGRIPWGGWVFSQESPEFRGVTAVLLFAWGCSRVSIVADERLSAMMCLGLIWPEFQSLVLGPDFGAGLTQTIAMPRGRVAMSLR